MKTGTVMGSGTMQRWLIGNGRFDDVEEYTFKDADGDGENEKHLIKLVLCQIIFLWIGQNPESPQIL